MTIATSDKGVHHGLNVKRIREILGVKQDILAEKMGGDWTQSRLSRLETKDEIEDDILELIANALDVPVDAIKNFKEEGTFFIIQHNHDNASNNSTYSYQCSFNAIDKLAEVMDENKKLYERLLREKEEMINRLDELLKRMK